MWQSQYFLVNISPDLFSTSGCSETELIPYCLIILNDNTMHCDQCLLSIYCPDTLIITDMHTWLLLHVRNIVEDITIHL